jgi:hypothetical protein
MSSIFQVALKPDADSTSIPVRIDVYSIRNVDSNRDISTQFLIFDEVQGWIWVYAYLYIPFKIADQLVYDNINKAANAKRDRY